MSEAPRIADQLKRSIRGTAWHGPSVLEIVEDITPDEAQRRPIPRAHSMAELVLHITAWVRAVTGGLDSGSAQLTAEEDWPPVPASFDWAAAREQLREAAKQLGARLETLADGDLDRVVRGYDQEFSTYVLLHGVVQHNIYHAGQLALLKKALRTS